MFAIPGTTAFGRRWIAGAWRRASAVTLVLTASVPAIALAQLPTISVSGSPSLLRIASATAGAQPNAVTNSATTYSFNNTGLLTAKITAQLNSAMPLGTTLTLTAAAPSGAATMGAVTLDATARNLITGIAGMASGSNLTLTYQLSATVDAGVIPSGSRAVTLTITTEP